MMLKFSIGIVVAMVVLGLPCASAADIIVNGGFENGFTGWSTTGITSIQTAAFGSGPTQGTQDALMESGDGSGFTTAAGLASFLGLSAGVLQGIATDQVTGGSAINQTITVNARDALTFDWNFLTNEATALSGGASTSFNDLAFVSLSSGGTGTATKLADTFSSFTSSSTKFAAETGFSTQTITFATGGTYTLGFGVVNVTDQFGDSGLLLDNVNVTPAVSAVPEPSTLVTTSIGVGFMGLGYWWRRRRQAAAGS